jgi:hypothetical protein
VAVFVFGLAIEAQNFSPDESDLLNMETLAHFRQDDFAPSLVF